MDFWVQDLARARVTRMVRGKVIRHTPTLALSSGGNPKITLYVAAKGTPYVLRGETADKRHRVDYQ